MSDGPGKLEHEGPILGRIHAESNYRKALAYWLGFLRGVLASDDVEQTEIAPLATEARNFLQMFGRDTAAIFVRDIDRLQPMDGRHAYAAAEAILARRRNEVALDEPKDIVNEFYGFCAGIACDNIISPGEVQRLIGRITPDLMRDTRIAGLHKAASLSIQDGRVTADESEDICQWITKLVGDSAADTGLATFGNVGIIDGAIEDHGQIAFDGRMFVLTGKFQIGPRKAVANMIAERGGRFKDSVCGKTDYLAVAATASRDWKHSHEGTKIIYAMELRQKGGSPNIVVEHILAKALQV